MNDNEIRGWGIALVIAFILGSLLSFFTVKNSYEEKAIKHNAAYYHPQTGEFKWNDEK